MTELSEYDQICGQITGLVDTVKQLTPAEQVSWASITRRLKKLPLNEDVDAICFHMLGKVQHAQIKKTDLNEANELVHAAEKALHQVTTIHKLLHPTGAFSNWLVENRDSIGKNTLTKEQLINSLLFYIARSTEQ